MSTTNILDLNNRIDELEKNSGGGGSADSAKRSDIATEFSTETSYTAGNFVYYEGKLYQFNADHSAGAWDPTDVVEANVTDQIVSNKSAIDGLTASDVAYDNTDSGLTATNVQNAVDELSESYPADKVILSDGVTSVEDALDGLNVSGYDITLNTTNVQKQTVQIAKLGKVLIISACFTTKASPGTDIGVIKYNGQAVTLATGAYCVAASDGTGHVVQISADGSITFVTTPVGSKWYNIMFIVTLA
jgi:hypothetical protein